MQTQKTGMQTLGLDSCIALHRQLALQSLALGRQFSQTSGLGRLQHLHTLTRLLPQTLGQPGDQLRQRFADMGLRHPRAIAALLLVDLLEKTVNRALGAGIAQLAPHGIDRWIAPVGDQAIPGPQNVRFIDARPCHVLSFYYVLRYIMMYYVLFYTKYDFRIPDL